jgi:hypothetical protein
MAHITSITGSLTVECKSSFSTTGLQNFSMTEEDWESNKKPEYFDSLVPFFGFMSSCGLPNWVTNVRPYDMFDWKKYCLSGDMGTTFKYTSLPQSCGSTIHSEDRHTIYKFITFFTGYTYDLPLNGKRGKKRIKDWFRRVLGWNKNFLIEGKLFFHDSHGIDYTMTISNQYITVDSEKSYFRHTINLEEVK